MDSKFDYWDNYGPLVVEARDGRQFEMEGTVRGIIVYVCINEFTGEKTVRRIPSRDVRAIAIHDEMPSVGFCVQCGLYYPDDFKHCKECGAELEWKTPE